MTAPTTTRQTVRVVLWGAGPTYAVTCTCGSVTGGYGSHSVAAWAASHHAGRHAPDTTVTVCTPKEVHP